MSSILNFIKEIFIFIKELVIRIVFFFWGWFVSLSLWNKAILFTIALSLAGILLPVARFYIIDFWYEKNNPLFLQLVFIDMVMFLLFFFAGIWVLGVRLLLSAYYFIHMLILGLTGSLSQADSYTIAEGFYVNLLLALLFAAFSTLAYREE